MEDWYKNHLVKVKLWRFVKRSHSPRLIYFPCILFLMSFAFDIIEVKFVNAVSLCSSICFLHFSCVAEGQYAALANLAVIMGSCLRFFYNCSLRESLRAEQKPTKITWNSTMDVVVKVF